MPIRRTAAAAGIDSKQITEITRRNIVDALMIGKIRVSWSGRFNEVEFLSRLFNLKELPSKDYRFETASDDIQQHCVNNNDWNPDWVFYDDRFNLLHGSDDLFLRFLCEMVHPSVRRDALETTKLVKLFNEHLVKDGCEIAETTRISGSPAYAARALLAGPAGSVKTAKRVAFALDTHYVSQQITRMESAIGSDPELAIGTAKEFLETICKTILSERGTQYERDEKLPRLVKLTVEELRLVPEELSQDDQAIDGIRILLKNLAAIGHQLAELRNPFGTGHGKEAKHTGLEPKHARLAVGAASTLGVFLFECHRENK